MDTESQQRQINKLFAEIRKIKQHVGIEDDYPPFPLALGTRIVFENKTMEVVQYGPEFAILRTVK